MTQPCGCATPQTADKEYLLVGATASEASACGTGEGSTLDPQCSKTEPSYDESLSDFVIPLADSSTSVLVCNSAIYAVGMWLSFINPYADLKITAIVGNVLTLVNTLDGFTTIPSNPDVGIAIKKGSKFVPVSKPNGPPSLDDVADALSSATEICAPSLETCSETAVVRVVGRVESDPSDTGVGKCIKGIFAFLMKAGRPVFSGLGDYIEPFDPAYSPLSINRTTHEVRRKKKLSETAGLLAGRRYVLGVTSGSEMLLGPTYITKITLAELYKTTLIDDVPRTGSGWPTIGTTSITEDHILSDIPALVLPEDASTDHYYANVRFELVTTPSASDHRNVTVQLNGEFALNGFTTDDFRYTQTLVSMPVKIMKSDHKLSVKLIGASGLTCKYQYRIIVDSLMY